MATVLIIDDSPTEVHLMTGMLEGAGYKVISAGDGESGLEMARSESPDLILMDVVMPGLNGFQATRELSKDAATSSIPVVMVTTKDQETDKTWGLRQGAKDYVVKPVSGDVLIEKIKSAMA